MKKISKKIINELLDEESYSNILKEAVIFFHQDEWWADEDINQPDQDEMFDLRDAYYNLAKSYKDSDILFYEHVFRVAEDSEEREFIRKVANSLFDVEILPSFVFLKQGVSFHTIERSPNEKGLPFEIIKSEIESYFK